MAVLSTGAFAPTKASAVSEREIAGTVTLPPGTDRDWLQAVYVHATGEHGGSGSAAVDPTGSYSISDLAADSYEVFFSVGTYWDGDTEIQPNLISEYYDDTTDYSAAQRVDVTAADASGIDASLALGRSISGTVTLPVGADAMWLRGISVYAAPLNGGSGRSAQVDPTNGDYTIIGLPAGAYRIQFDVNEYWNEDDTTTRPNLVTEYYDDATEYSDAQHVDVTATDASDIDATLALGRTISGTVTLPVGADPEWLRAVSVYASLPDGGNNNSARVDPTTGDYTITGLLADAYRIQFTAHSYWDGATEVRTHLVSEYYEDTVDYSSATLVDLRGGDATGIDAALAQGRSISGRVSLPDDVDPAWLRGVSVSAQGIAGGYAHGAVDALTGEYTVSGLAPGDYRVQFTTASYWEGDTQVTPNLINEYYNEATDYASAEIVDVSEADATGIDATLSKGRSISGRITLPDRADSEWLRGVRVNATPESGGSSASGVVDPLTGEYSISGLAGVGYRVQFSATSYWNGATQVLPNLVSEYFDDAIDYSSARLIDLSAGDATGIDATLALGRSISGAVTLPEGTDRSWLRGVFVSASKADDSSGYGSSAVDPDTGEYTVSGLAPGAYAVQFHVNPIYDGTVQFTPNLVSEYYEGAFTRENATAVDVTSADQAGVNASLETGTRISGTVSIPADAPKEWLKGVWVSAIGADERISESATVDMETGEYTLGRLPAGEYRLSFSPGGYWNGTEYVPTKLAREFYDDATDLSLATPVSTATGDRAGIDVELGYGSRLAGTVDISALQQTAGGDYPSYSFFLTDTSGTNVVSGFGGPYEDAVIDFDIGNLTPGSYRLAVTSATWDESTSTAIPSSAQYLRDGAATSFTVAAGEEVTDLDLTARAADATISGVLEATSFEPSPVDRILGSALVYERIDGEWVRLPGDARFDSNTNGATPFELDVSAGTYTVGYESDYSTAGTDIVEEWWQNRSTLMGADQVVVRAGESKGNINGTIRPVGSAPVDPGPELDTPGAFASLEPARLLDTRVGTGAPRASVGPNQSVTVQVTGRGGVPATGVSAVVMNVTATGPTQSGFITAYPAGTTQPTASNINFTNGQTIPNLVTVKLGQDGKVTLTNNSPGTVNLIADVAGYYLSGSGGE